MTHSTRVPCRSGCGRARVSTNEGDLHWSGWRCNGCRRALPIDHPEWLAPLVPLTPEQRAVRQAAREARQIERHGRVLPRRTAAQVARERAVLAALEALHPQHLAAALEAEAVASGFSSWRFVEAATSGPRGPVREAAWQVRGRRSVIAEELGWLGRWRTAAQGMHSDEDLTRRAPSIHPLAQALLAEVLATAQQPLQVAS